MSDPIHLFVPTFRVDEVLAEIRECLDVIQQAKHRADDAFRQSHFVDEAKRRLEEKEIDLREAVAADRVVVRYQPILDLGPGEVIAVEALARLRGQPLSYQNIPLVVTYHPAYLLRTPSDKRKAWEDLRRARSIIAETATS